MKAVLLALALATTPAAAADSLFALYASGQYEAAMRAGAESGTAESLAIAARAALADAAMRPQPCLSCLKRAEDFARRAVAADPRPPEGHVWLAAALGLEGHIIGVVRARLAGSPAEAKAQLDTALQDSPGNAYALTAMGGWNIEIVRLGGAFLAQKLYGASEAEGFALFERAIKAAPGNVAIHYQIALVLAGYRPEALRPRIAQELEAAIHATPATAYEKFIQARAAELLALLKHDDTDAFTRTVHQFQGYP